MSNKTNQTPKEKVEKPKQLSEMTLTELRATAYVCFVNIQVWQNDIQRVEAEIQKRVALGETE